MEHKQGQHPNSLANLGKPKTKKGMRRFRFIPPVDLWLEGVKNGGNMTGYVESLILADMSRVMRRDIDGPVDVDGKNESVVDVRFDMGQDRDNKVLSLHPHCSAKAASEWIEWCFRHLIEYEQGVHRWYTTIDRWVEIVDSLPVLISPCYDYSTSIEINSFMENFDGE